MAETTVKTSKGPDSRTRKIFFGIEFINGLRRAIFFTLIVLYFIHLGHDPVKVTAMVAVSRIILAISEFPTGMFADRYSRKASIILSFFIMGLSLMGFFLFSGFWMLSFCYILGDIGWTFQSGTSVAWAIDNLKYGKHKSKITSLLSLFFFFERIGAIIGGIIGYIIVGMEFRYVWLFIALVNFLMAAILMKIMEERNFTPLSASSKGNKRHVAWQALIQAKETLGYIFAKTETGVRDNQAAQRRHLRALAIGVVAASITIDSFLILAPLVFFQALGLGADVISSITGGVSVILLFAALLAGHVANKAGYRNTMTIIFISMAASILIFAYSRSTILSITALAVVAIGDYSGGIISLSLQQHNTPSKMRASIGSAFNALWSISNALSAALISSGILFFGLVTTTALTSVFALITAGIYFFSFRDAQ